MSAPLSRRSFIIASAAVAATLNNSQASDASFTVKSRSGLRMERHGDPQRPSVALYLPKRAYPSVVIEMPEHAWYRESQSGPLTWFYKMHGSDPAFQGQVEWSQQSDSLSYLMNTPSGFMLRSKVTLNEEELLITLEASSSKTLHMAALQAPTCVKLYRPFTDVFLERTFVHTPDSLAFIASDTPDRLTKNAEEWLPCRYIARVGSNAPRQPYRTEVLDGVTRYFKSEAANAAFIASQSSPAGWTAATYASHCDSVFTNPARTCQHADPEARDITDGRAALSLNVLVIRGDVKDAWNRIKWNSIPSEAMRESVGLISKDSGAAEEAK